MRIKDDFSINYSSKLFEPGGLVNQYLPYVAKKVVGIRDLH